VNPHTLFIAIAVLIDLTITVAVISYVLRKRGLLSVLTTGLEKFRTFSAETSEMAQNHLLANYSGNPEDLPAVLTSLLDQIEQKAKEQNIALNRDALKMVLLRSVQSQQGMNYNDLQKAMRKVA
jgi:hypothetical protein